MRVFIHPGFHKTGTTSAQALLADNRKLLRRHIHFFLKWRFKAVTDAALRFSTHRTAFEQAEFGLRFKALLGGLDVDPTKPLLLSSEELAGHLPGRRGLVDYSAAPILAQEMAQAVFERWGEDTELTFIVTTRGANSWLRSAYNHHVTRSDLALDWDAYYAQFSGAAEFDPILAAMQADAPAARFVTTALEDTKSVRLGPGAALLEPLGLPAHVLRKVQPVSRRNPGLSAVQVARCLELNRSDMAESERAVLKMGLVEQHLEAAGMDKPE